jgi:hypothetical protein
VHRLVPKLAEQRLRALIQDLVRRGLAKQG